MILTHPISLLFLLLLLPLAWFWWKSLVDQEARKKFIAITLRALGFILLVLALCQPYWKRKSEALHVLYLIDGSQSISPASLKEMPQWISESQATLRAQDASETLLFAESLRKVSAEELKDFSAEAEAGTTEGEFRAASRISEALKGAQFFFPQEKAKRIILLSDGTPTSGALSETLADLATENIEVFFHPLAPLDKPEVAALSLTPSSAFSYQGEMMRLTAKLQSNRDQSVQARLLHRGVVVAQDTIALKANQETSCYFDTEMHTPGANLWSLEVSSKEDYFTSNNKVSTTIKVKGMPRYLVIHEDERVMSPFSRAMKKQGILLETRGEFGLPKTLNELLAYDGVILANVSATAMSSTQMENLQRYVTDFGGGLLMLGSDNSYGLGGYYKTPVEDVLPLTSRYEKEKQKPSLAMVLVIDKSGSMSGQPIEMARSAALAAAELLGPNDQIAVLGFSGDAHLICDLTNASDQASIRNAIGSLDAGGGTNLQPAMMQGKRILEGAVAKVKHMIILSDGQTGGEGYQDMAQDMAAQQMTVSTVALGSGAAKDLMQLIATEGRGRYYEAEEPSQMPQIFTKETMKASRSSIKEDLFNSVIVGDHPALNGYENAELPFILGYVMTRPKPTAQVLLAAETGDPLLAISRFGLGMGAAYTSDLTEKWGSEWLNSAAGLPFWAQVLRSVARKEESAGLSAVLSTQQDELTVTIKRLNERGETVEKVPWNILATDKSGEPIPHEIKQTGLGTYQLKVSAHGKEQVDLRLHDTLAQLTKSLHWKRPYSAEYQLNTTPAPALQSLPKPESLTTDITPSHTYQNMSWVFVLLGLLSVIGGLVFRRL